jgi:hypothetical protein
MSPSSHLTVKLLFKTCHYYSKLDFFPQTSNMSNFKKKYIFSNFLFSYFQNLGPKFLKQVLGPIPIMVFGFGSS